MRRSLLFVTLLASALLARAQTPLRQNWRIASIERATESGQRISSPGYDDRAWYAATVPGTALTSFVDDGLYPDPSFGENDRPESIPESLNQTAYWYRTTVVIPANHRGRHTWLRFNGINYAAELWVNGYDIGSMRGAFRRFAFDITSHVVPGTRAVIAVRVEPQPHPGTSHEHTLTAGLGHNGGATAMDGPTFLATIGWDWMPAMRDRDTGLWQDVLLDSTGDILVRDLHVVTSLPLPDTSASDLRIAATAENLADQPRTITLDAVVHSALKSDAPIHLTQRVTLGAHEAREIVWDHANAPALHVIHPHLWWPNGYGDHPLYTLDVSAADGRGISSSKVSTTFGIRQIQYTRNGSDNLALSVNGVPVFVRGGDWGMDEERKRIPRERLETAMRFHALANLNLIRNWVGQSTSDDFYDLADRYGLLLWDEFFQPNPSDGPNPEDLETYLANVRDKVLRYRNHPSIALWCARNEGPPPPAIDAALKQLLPELDPSRLYQPSSTDGRGVRSGGPYRWRTPESFYKFPDTEAFKTEIGSVSVPTLDSIHGMMPQKDWETINDDWAEHDFAKSHSGSETYPADMAKRYGAPLNLADFARKAQMMNYEAFRAMYEGRAAKLNQPVTGIVTWMSHPAQPSFVWQLYHYDFDPMSSLFAVQSAAEPVHVQWNEATDAIELVNNTAKPFAGKVAATIYGMDGSRRRTQSFAVSAESGASADAGTLHIDPARDAVSFVQLQLLDADGKVVSRNTYWRAAKAGDLTAMAAMPSVELTATIRTPHIAANQETFAVTLRNPTPHVAVLAHLQLRNAATNDRILPAFPSTNYVTLMPGESRDITITFDPKLLHGARPLVTLDGWNTTLKAVSAFGVTAHTNVEADPSHWPVTHLPYATEALRLTPAKNAD